MPGLSTELEAVFRAGHVISAVIWIGFVVFMAFVRPKAIAGMSEAATREFMPRLAKAITPWMMWSAISTFAFGLVVYWSMGSNIGFENIGWTLNMGVLIALIMFLLGLFFVVPTAKKVAGVLEGGAPPKPSELQRLGQVTILNAVLGFFVVFLMVMHSALGNSFL